MKNTPVIIASIASLGIVISSVVLGSAFKNRNQSENTISVTGLGTKQFTSDLITWSGRFSRDSYEIKEAYNALAQDRKVIFDYLQSQGIKSNEVVFSAVDIEKKYNYSTDNEGNSRSTSPQYFYTKLAGLKQEMIADATKDAKERAEKIAKNSGSGLGKLKKATMGVIQITAPNSDEDYSYGGTFNTHSKEKEASITIKLEYQVD